MGNKNICATRINIDGTYYPFTTHRFYARGTDPHTGEDTLVRIRHYRDFAKINPRDQYSGTTTVVAVPKDLATSGDLSLDDLIDELDPYRAFNPTGQRNQLLAQGIVFGACHDMNRIQQTQERPGRRLTGEGGIGYQRPLHDELYLLAANDRASDTYYETAEQRAQRRRDLVAQLKNHPEKLRAVVEKLKNSRQRVPAITIAVDACAIGAYGAGNLLETALTRPDDLALAITYHQQTHGKLIPRTLRTVIARRASELLDESACIRFDRKRSRGIDNRSDRQRGHRLADVIRICRPRPRDEQQSRLFAAILSNYENTDGLPLLTARKELLAAGPDKAAEILAAAAERARSERAENGHTSEPLAALPWQLLVSATSRPRPQVTQARAALETARRELDTYMKQHDTPVDTSTTEPGRALLADHPRSAYRRHREHVKRLQANIDAATRELAKARAATAGVNPDVWRLTIGSMSATETLSNLAAIERSGVAEELHDDIARRINSRPASIPETLRCVRGIAVSTARVTGESPKHWTRVAKSTFEPLLERSVQERVDTMTGPVSGNVLILVDGSGSMGDLVSARTNDQRAADYRSSTRAEVAAFAAAAIASACETTPDVYAYDTRAVKIDTSGGIFDNMRTIVDGLPGGGTDTFGVLTNTYQQHDLVVILTDEQTGRTPGQRRASQRTPYRTGPQEPDIDTSGTQFVIVNLAGYAAAQSPQENITTIAGWSEDLFTVIADVNNRRPANQPDSGDTA